MSNSSFDNFQLPNPLLVELYKNSLIDLEQPQSIQHSLNESNPVKLGHFNKKILVLVNEPEDLHVNDVDLQFLTGILNACQWSLADIALINLSSNASWSWQQAIQHFQPVLSIGFGLTEKQSISVGAPSFYRTTALNQTKIIAANRLSQLAQLPEEKKALWACLKSELNR
jgi:hypothetical protein